MRLQDLIVDPCLHNTQHLDLTLVSVGISFPKTFLFFVSVWGAVSWSHQQRYHSWTLPRAWRRIQTAQQAHQHPLPAPRPRHPLRLTIPRRRLWLRLTMPLAYRLLDLRNTRGHLPANLVVIESSQWELWLWRKVPWTLKVLTVAIRV